MLNEFICINSKDAKMTPATEVIENILSTGKKEKYYCPICGEEMIFKNCTEKEKHFSHKADTRCNYGKGKGGESETHKIAKRYLAENIGDTFTVSGNEIIGNGKTFILGGSKKIVVKEIHIEKSLKEILNLNRDYRPDVFIEALTGEMVALEIYNTHAKTQEDIENLKEKDVIVYEIDIKGLKELTITDLYDRMKLIYSLNMQQLESTLGNIRNEYRKIQNENKRYDDKIKDLESKIECLKRENEIVKRESEWLQYYKNENSNLQGKVNDLKRTVEGYETKFPNSGSMDGYIKEVTSRVGTMYLKVGNSRTGDIIIISKDDKNFPFFRDMEGGFGKEKMEQII